MLPGRPASKVGRFCPYARRTTSTRWRGIFGSASRRAVRMFLPTCMTQKYPHRPQGGSSGTRSLRFRGASPGRRSAAEYLLRLRAVSIRAVGDGRTKGGDAFSVVLWSLNIGASAHSSFR
jgi:hypothetical protein